MNCKTTIRLIICVAAMYGKKECLSEDDLNAINKNSISGQKTRMLMREVTCSPFHKICACVLK